MSGRPRVIRGGDGGPRSFEKLMTTGEVAETFRVTAKTVRQWCEKKLLHPVYTLGGHRRFRESEVQAVMRGEKPDVHDN